MLFHPYDFQQWELMFKSLVEVAVEHFPDKMRDCSFPLFRKDVGLNQSVSTVLWN